MMQERIANQLDMGADYLHMADGFPIPICKFKRAYFSKSFKDRAAYGYCASKAETYYGFKGNLLINATGVIKNITITSANIDERESLWDIVGNINGLLIADKGLIGKDYQKQLLNEAQINLQTPMKNNMKDAKGKDAAAWLISTRRLVGTVIGQLSERFNIQKVRARDMWHFTNRIVRKVLAHTVSACINKLVGNEILQFDMLMMS